MSDSIDNWWIDFAQNKRLCKVIANYYGWETKFLEVNNRETLCMIDTGREWVSIPHISYGGLTQHHNLSEVFEREGLQNARWQVRGIIPFSDYYRANKVTNYLRLSNDTEKQLYKFPSSVRRKIRRAQKFGLKVNEGKEELLGDFYNVYSKNLHQLGSPALPKKFILSLLSDYDDNNTHTARLFVVYKDQKAIGGGLLLVADSSYENLLFASLKEYNRMYTSYMLHWAMICFSIAQKAMVYSFGRSSKDSGVHIYKKQWNTLELPVYWSYSHPLKRSIKDMKFLAGLYRMIPFSIAKRIGPWFASRIY